MEAANSDKKEVHNMWKQYKKELVVGGILLSVVAFSLGCVFNASTGKGPVSAQTRIEQKAQNDTQDQQPDDFGQHGPGKDGQKPFRGNGQFDHRGPQSGGQKQPGQRPNQPSQDNGQNQPSQQPNQPSQDNGQNQPGQQPNQPSQDNGQKDDGTQQNDATTSNKDNTSAEKKS